MFVKPEHRRSCHRVATLALLSSAFGFHLGDESFAAGLGLGGGRGLGASATAAAAGLGASVGASVGGASRGATTSVGVSSPAASGSVGVGLGRGVVGSSVGTAVGASATAAGVSLGGAVSASPAGATASVGVSSPATGSLGVGGSAGLGGVGVSGSGAGLGVSAGLGGGQGLGLSAGGAAAGASVGAASGTSRNRAAASVGISSAIGVGPGVGAGMPSGSTDGGAGSMAGATGSRGIGATPSGGLSAVSRRQTWSGANEATASYGYADPGYPSVDTEETGPVAVYSPDVPAFDQSRYDRSWRRPSSAQEIILPRCTHNHCTTLVTRGSGIVALRAEKVLFLHRAERPWSPGPRGPSRVVTAALGRSAPAVDHAELRAGNARQTGALAARALSSPGGARAYGRASPERLAPKAAPIRLAGKSLARGVLVASLGPAGTAASDSAGVDRSTNNAVLVPTPIPIAERIVSGKEVELLWSSRRPSEPVKFFVEMRVLGSAGSHEVYSSFTERSSVVASVPVAGGEYAWRVSAVAPHAGRYATSQWLRFKVRP